MDQERSAAKSYQFYYFMKYWVCIYEGVAIQRTVFDLPRMSTTEER